MSKEEGPQIICRLLGQFLREEMPCHKGFAADFVGPFLPETDRTAFLVIPAVERSLGAPECQNRTGDTPASLLIRLIMVAVDSGRSAGFLADGMCMLRIAQGLGIGFTNVCRKYPG